MKQKSKRFTLVGLLLFATGFPGILLLCGTAPANGEKQPFVAQVPAHDIKYDESHTPEWKSEWDLARSLCREGKYAEALVQYELLLTKKANIDEARWEYASILMLLKRWRQAREELEKLIGAEPGSIRYRTAMARLRMEIGDPAGSVDLYRQMLEEQTTDQDRAALMEELAEALVALGEKDEAVAVLEQLSRYRPDDDTVLLRRAELALDLGRLDTAKELAAKLEKKSPRDLKVYILCARVEEMNGNSEEAALFWQNVIALEPGHSEANRSLYKYYAARGNWPMSLRHLEALIQSVPGEVSLLMEAAELNEKMGRLDRALEYYENAQVLEPLNEKIAGAKKNALRRLASDLLVLVENKEGEELWHDLEKVAPDSVGVYREMANLLREQGKEEELIEVLTLLSRRLPDDEAVRGELADLRRKLSEQRKFPASDRSGGK